MSTVLLPTPEVLAQFNRDGFLIVPDVLTPAEVATYRTALERVFAVPNADAELYGMPAIWRPKLFEHGPEFDSSIDHPGVAQFIDAVLGDDCHLIAHTGLKTSPGKVFGFWHQDDHCRFPIPDGLQLDPRIPMPTFTINMNYYLCDVDEELGPTQFIPGSHRAGRVPRESDNDASGTRPMRVARSSTLAARPAPSCSGTTRLGIAAARIFPTVASVGFSKPLSPAAGSPSVSGRL